jgi:hypothetical protein
MEKARQPFSPLLQSCWRPSPASPQRRSPAAFQRSGTEGAACAVDSRSGDHERPPFHVVFLLLSQPTPASTSTPADVAGGRLSIEAASWSLTSPLGFHSPRSFPLAAAGCVPLLYPVPPEPSRRSSKFVVAVPFFRRLRCARGRPKRLHLALAGISRQDLDLGPRAVEVRRGIFFPDDGAVSCFRSGAARRLQAPQGEPLVT